MGKTLPEMQESQVQFLDQEDPLEKGMATSPVFLPGAFHKQRGLAGYTPWVTKHGTELSDFHFSVFPLHPLSREFLS